MISVIRLGRRARSLSTDGTTDCAALAPGAMSICRAALPTPGAAMFSAAITPAQNRVGSLSPGSTDSHALLDVSPDVDQSRSMQVFPQPAGATTTTSLAAVSSETRSSSAWRTTLPALAAGGRSAERTISAFDDSGSDCLDPARRRRQTFALIGPAELRSG